MAYEHRLGGPFSYVDGLATTPVGQAGPVYGRRVPVTGSHKSGQVALSLIGSRQQRFPDRPCCIR